jgi:Tol biopolymer transport system component
LRNAVRLGVALLVGVATLTTTGIVPSSATGFASTVSGQIVFQSARDGNNEIYVMNGDGSSQTRLTDDPADDAWPALSPDGTKVAFVSDRTGNRELYEMSSDGSDVVQLTNTPVVAEDNPSWSPDGKLIAYTGHLSSKKSEIYTIDPVTLAVTQLTKARRLNAEPAYSPNGRSIAFLSTRTTTWQVWTMKSNGRRETQLTFEPGVNEYAHWSPDGASLAFMSDMGGNFDVYTMTAQGTNITDVTNDPSSDAWPVWSPDGSRVAFSSSRDGDTEIYSMLPDGSDVRQLTVNTVSDDTPEWSTGSVAKVLTSIAVTPANASIRQEGAQQYTATGTYSDGSSADLSTEVTWSSSNQGVATISNTPGSQGLATASDTPGSTTIGAVDGSVSGSTTLTVACRLHADGLGQTYADCAPLGTPGNPATYSQTMALEAAHAWNPSGLIFHASCGSGANVANVIVYQATGSGPTATWTYGATGSYIPTVGHVYLSATADAFCAQPTDPAWN